MPLLDAVEQTTHTSPDSAVIWLHGLGADGNDFAPIIPALRLSSELKIRFIFPHAPSVPVTVNGGFVMPAWYDIKEMQIDRDIDIDGLLASVREIERFVEQEIGRNIAPERIVLAGFSQGGAVALHVALSYPERLAGLLALSTYFATRDQIALNDANRRLPIEIQHGTDDPVVPEILGRQTADYLTENGYQVCYRTYPMEHNVCPEQIADISVWLHNVLARP